MNELEWLACEIPEVRMHEYRVAPSTRKRQLLDVACCRRLSHRLAEWPIAVRILDVAEQFAEGAVSAEEVWAEYLTFSPYHRHTGRLPGHANPLDPLRYLFITSRAGGRFSRIPKSVRRVVPKKERRDEFRAQSELPRDIFGNPFRSVALAPAWRTETVVALGRGTCESRDFSAMPILADALQDAGCDNNDVLTHCRNTSRVHARGCWVVDLVLGKP